MKRRNALISVFVVVALGGLGELWYFGHFARFGFGSTPAIRNARARAAGFSKTVAIEPYGLIASVPETFACKHRVETRCLASGEDPASVEWRIKPAQSREDPHDLNPDFKEGVATAEELVGLATLAGFEGFVVSWRERGPGRGCYFTGWLRDPARGLLQLTVAANETCDNDPDVLGVILSTRAADAKATGPARSWPDDATRAAQAKLADQFDALSDDQAPEYRWADALGEIVFRGEPSAPMAGEALRARTAPSVSELAKRRIETLTSGGGRNQLEQAWAMTGQLELWDRPVALPLKEPIAQKARSLAIGAGTTDTQEARLSRSLDCRITGELSRDQLGSSRAIELSRVLAPLGLLELHASIGCASVLWRHRKAPEIATLLDGWHDPKNIQVPADLDYLDLAEFAQAHFEKDPLLRRHALAMLENKSPGGRLTVREKKNYSVESKHRSFGTYEHVGWAIPEEGTTMPLRVCDIYAIRFAHGFVPYAPVATRDRWIKDAIATLRKTPATH